MVTKTTNHNHHFSTTNSNLTLYLNKPSKANNSPNHVSAYKHTMHNYFINKFPMVRTLPLDHHLTSISQAGFAAGTLLLCAFALFMCVSHSRKWHKWRSCYGYYNNDDPIIIQLNQEGMIHEFKNGEQNEYSGEGSLWQKNILMGGKCQLPDFSGVIIYDSEGNIVPPTKAPLALTWK